MQAQAIKDYELYTRQQWLTHEPLDLRLRDFERPDKCGVESCQKTCENKHEACYRNCGGSVETTSSCAFLCF
jgi:hypothetical protein